MGMFTNYDNIQPDYIPSNFKPQPPQCNCPTEETRLAKCSPKKPYEDYNALGEIVGYWWKYGDTINLEFNIEGEVIIESDGSNAGGETNVYVPAAEYLEGKNIVVSLYNFRKELVVSRIFEGTPKIIFGIDKELSKELVQGVYYCTVTVSSAELDNTIFYQEDCTFTVK